ncbi:hypothetical protein VTO73DRAFT_946 [Trametes versicolor]
MRALRRLEVGIGHKSRALASYVNTSHGACGWIAVVAAHTAVILKRGAKRQLGAFPLAFRGRYLSSHQLDRSHGMQGRRGLPANAPDTAI